MYPCDPISFKYMKIRGEASYYYAEIKEFVKEFFMLTGCVDLILMFLISNMVKMRFQVLGYIELNV